MISSKGLALILSFLGNVILLKAKSNRKMTKLMYLLAKIPSTIKMQGKKREISNC